MFGMVYKPLLSYEIVSTMVMKIFKAQKMDTVNTLMVFLKFI